MPRMRDSQIMFRVFDQEVGEMVDQHMHVFGECFAFGRVEDWIKNHREAKGDKTILERLNDMILMQFVGLHDHTNWDELTDEEKDQWYNREEDWKGKPIYEGDIIEICEGHLWDNHYHIVEYGGTVGDYPGFDLEPILDGEVNSLQEAFLNRSIKVAGNKFEDQNILSKVKNH